MSVFENHASFTVWVAGRAWLGTIGGLFFGIPIHQSYVFEIGIPPGSDTPRDYEHMR